MALEINGLLAFANSLRSLAQQIEKLANQSSQNDTGSQNLVSSFSAALDSARDELTATQQSPSNSENTTDSSAVSEDSQKTDLSAYVPSWLTSALSSQQADRDYWAASQAAQQTMWQDNPEALSKLQQTYSPDGVQRLKAVAWLNEHVSPNWWLNARHVMETGKLLSSPLPDYLQEHYERYQQLAADTAHDTPAQERWRQNPEALHSLQETYNPDLIARQKAIAWLSENMGSNWRIGAPSVLETANMLAALDQTNSDLTA